MRCIAYKSGLLNVYLIGNFSGKLPSSQDLLTKEDMVKIKRCIFSLQRSTLPPITTHNVVDDYKDPVLTSLRRCQLFNSVNDRVKVSIFYTEHNCSQFWKLD